MIVVSNASPLLALAQADCLHVLRALFARVLTPAAVYRETVDQCTVPPQQRRIQSACDVYSVPVMPSVDPPGFVSAPLAPLIQRRARGVSGYASLTRPTHWRLSRTNARLDLCQQHRLKVSP